MQQKTISDLVVGGSLKALEFAFREGYHIYYDSLQIPFRLEQTKEGIAKKNIIENYAFLLSLSGLNLSSNKTYSSRLQDECIVLNFKSSASEKIYFKNLHDMSLSIDDSKTYKVIDYINIRSCGHHDIKTLNTKEDFVKEIYFYPSKRVNSSKNFNLFTHDYETCVKDCMLVSYINGKDLENEDYSQIYSRLKLKEIMKEVGITGKRSGKTKTGKINYAPIKLEFAKREIKELEEERNYFYTKSKNEYLNKIYNFLYGRNTTTKED